MRMLALKAAIAATAISTIAGCAVTPGEVNTTYDAGHRAALDALNAEPLPLPLVEDVDTAFLGDRQVPVAYDASLPAVFSREAGHAACKSRSQTDRDAHIERDGLCRPPEPGRICASRVAGAARSNRRRQDERRRWRCRPEQLRRAGLCPGIDG